MTQAEIETGLEKVHDIGAPGLSAVRLYLCPVARLACGVGLEDEEWTSRYGLVRVRWEPPRADGRATWRLTVEATVIENGREHRNLEGILSGGLGMGGHEYVVSK